MGFQILRFEKLKTLKALEGHCVHATRERHPDNADLAKKDQNELAGTTAATIKVFKARLAQVPKVRKDSVLAVEILVGFSPEESERLTRGQQDAYFRDAREWFVKRFGGEKNFLNCTIHRDETTSAHMSLFVMPIQTIIDKKTGLDREQFNCKHWLGGAAKLSQWQTHFHDEVSGHYGLDRGIHGSKARHQEVDRYYSLIKSAIVDASIPPAEVPKHKALRDPNTEIMEAVALRDAQLKPRIEALAVQAYDTERVSAENRALKKTIARKDRQIDELKGEITKLQGWIQKAKDIMIEGGAKLVAFVRSLMKERERPLTVDSPGATEKTARLVDIARGGGAKEVKDAWEALQAVRKASLPIVLSYMQGFYSRPLMLRDAEYFYDKDPRLEEKLKPFRELICVLRDIAAEKCLTVEGKPIQRQAKRERDIGLEL